MDKLKLIEQKNKFRNCIIKFEKYFYNLPFLYIPNIINDINEWINLYKNNNKSSDTNINNVNNFYNHISNISTLEKFNGSDYKTNMHKYFNNLSSFIEIKECRDFIRFLKNISNDDIEDEE